MEVLFSMIANFSTALYQDRQTLWYKLSVELLCVAYAEPTFMPAINVAKFPSATVLSRNPQGDFLI